MRIASFPNAFLLINKFSVGENFHITPFNKAINTFSINDTNMIIIYKMEIASYSSYCFFGNRISFALFRKIRYFKHFSRNMNNQWIMVLIIIFYPSRFLFRVVLWLEIERLNVKQFAYKVNIQMVIEIWRKKELWANALLKEAWILCYFFKEKPFVILVIPFVYASQTLLNDPHHARAIWTNEKLIWIAIRLFFVEF